MVNVDAATKEGDNAFALIGRDSFGSLVAAATCLAKGLNVDEAELKVILWAFDFAEWRN